MKSGAEQTTPNASCVGSSQLRDLCCSAEANLAILQTGRSPRIITPAELDGLRGSVASIDGSRAYCVQQLGSQERITPC
jgi:hypothetical protein